MGYYAQSVDSTVEFTPENAAKLLEVLKEKDYKTIEDFFDDYGYFGYDSDDGGYVLHGFDGKYRSEDFDEFLTTIAPFVSTGEFIAFKGEEGDYWRYLFAGGTYVEQQGRITWE